MWQSQSKRIVKKTERKVPRKAAAPKELAESLAKRAHNIIRDWLSAWTISPRIQTALNTFPSRESCGRHAQGFPSFISKHTSGLVRIHNSYILSSISPVLYAFSNLYKIGYCFFGIYCLVRVFMFFDHKHACISPLTIFKCGAKLFEKQKTNDSGIFAGHVTCRSGNFTFIVTIHYIFFLCELSRTRWDIKKKCANIYALWKFMIPPGWSCILRVIYCFWMVKYTIICQKRSFFFSSWEWKRQRTTEAINCTEPCCVVWEMILLPQDARLPFEQQ